MGITRKLNSGNGTEALEEQDMRERLRASERNALRQLISNAVRDEQVLDAKLWKEIKEKGVNGVPRSSRPDLLKERS